MAKRKNNTQGAEATGATVGYEAELWRMADALRGSMDAAEYKHVKYISDAFEKQQARREDPDEYGAVGVFWVPSRVRWSYLQAQAKQRE